MSQYTNSVQQIQYSYLQHLSPLAPLSLRIQNTVQYSELTLHMNQILFSFLLSKYLQYKIHHHPFTITPDRAHCPSTAQCGIQYTCCMWHACMICCISYAVHLLLHFADPDQGLWHPSFSPCSTLSVALSRSKNRDTQAGCLCFSQILQCTQTWVPIHSQIKIEIWLKIAKHAVINMPLWHSSFLLDMKKVHLLNLKYMKKGHSMYLYYIHCIE